MFFRGIAEYTNFIYLSGIFIGFILSFLLLKKAWVRKKIIGVRKGRNLLIISNIMFYAMFMLDAVGELWIAYGFSFAYCVFEVRGMLLFQVDYIESRYSKVKYFLDDGSQIICEDIEKVKGKRKHIIIDNEDNSVVIPYSRIERAEYFGEPKIILLNKKKQRKKRAKKVYSESSLHK